MSCPLDGEAYEPSQNQLTTVYNGASCFGYWFKNNQRYIIYAFEEGEHLNAWWCGGVIPETENTNAFKAELKELNKILENPLNKALNQDATAVAPIS